MTRRKTGLKNAGTAPVVKKLSKAQATQEDLVATEQAIESDKRLGRLSLEKGTLSKKYKHVLQANERLEEELTAALALKTGVSAFKIEPRASQRDSEATAFAIASDWHIEEEVKPSTVNGLNRYNLEIAKKRATEFFERIARLARKEQQDVVITELVLGLLGDFISGVLREEDREKALLLPLDAAIFAQELLQSGIEFLLNHTKLRITCICKVGNHGRTTAKIHMATETGNSLEWMMYHTLAQRFSTKDRVRFIIEDAYHTLVPIYGKVIRFHHGHAIKYHGGVGGITVPLNRVIAGWNKEQPAHMDVFGHLHTYMPLPRASGNGSLIGYSAFAIHKGFGFEPPQQSFFLFDKKRGKTVSMPILFSI
ncbi:MAG: hypothetical protein AAB421_01225 [Patescibacteria group bacterium]